MAAHDEWMTSTPLRPEPVHPDSGGPAVDVLPAAHRPRAVLAVPPRPRLRRVLSLIPAPPADPGRAVERARPAAVRCPPGPFPPRHATVSEGPPAMRRLRAPALIARPARPARRHRLLARRARTRPRRPPRPPAAPPRSCGWATSPTSPTPRRSSASSRACSARELGSTTLTTQTFNAGGDAVNALLGGSLDTTYIGSGPAINAFAKSERPGRAADRRRHRGRRPARGQARDHQPGAAQGPDAWRPRRRATPRTSRSRSGWSRTA